MNKLYYKAGLALLHNHNKYLKSNNPHIKQNCLDRMSDLYYLLLKAEAFHAGT
jgi:hypothetical protein